jgi:cyclic pyranopterin phosphate synthase
MYDSFNRKITYLRVSVTDRCNLRCTYCMPEEGITLLSHSDILPYEEMILVIGEAVKMGITKVRITGGEPLVRRGILGFIAMVAAIPGIDDLGLTTNGILLEEFASGLKQSGLHRINISLDTTDAGKFSRITRGGDITRVFRGIEAAKAAGLTPVKINCVVKNNSEEPDARAVKEFCREHDLEVRFIHEMDLESGCFTVVEGGKGGDCLQCNRLRLTADGYIRPCLFSDLKFSTRELGIRQALEAAVGLKPEKGSTNAINKFHNIGG